MTQRMTLERLPDTFWSRVTRGDGCWIWGGTTMKGGYGSFWLRDGLVPGAPPGGERYRGRMHPATRVAWYLTHGRWPRDGYDMCHTCDNPPCVNPAHLWEGTEADNAADMVHKGRVCRVGAPQGERHPDHKLTDAQVREVLRRTRAGESQRAVAAHFGITQQTVSLYVRGVIRKAATAPEGREA